MIDLVEELQTGETVFIMVKTFKDFLFGEYIVTETKYKSIKNRYAKLSLKSAEKKKRYFKDIIELEGFHIEFKKNQNEMLLFNSFDDMIENFCKMLNKEPDINSKLTKKFKSKYPKYFNLKKYV